MSPHARRHRAYLETGALPQSTQCFVCHNGTGASADIAAQYATATANDAATASYYQHPATAADSGHTNANLEEFKGVLNRHSECTDCHNPHSPTLATGDPSTMTPSGWTVSGALGGASGVAVDFANVPAGQAPTPMQYALVNTPPSDESDAPTYPDPTGPLTYEYQLCLKCHSGYTQLPSTTSPASIADHPSRWALDKGAELNPANGSYHPVAAVGRNTSTFIDCSLSGSCLPDTNTYRLWTPAATDTIRCTQCHSSGVTAATPPGASLEAHANTNRGLLTQAFRDRDLHLSTEESFVASEFALCFSCHAVAPFATRSTSERADTAFRVHSVHLGFFTGSGTDVSDIDRPGAGAGTAICSECHFRTHSTALKYGLTGRTQTGTDAGLVKLRAERHGVGPGRRVHPRVAQEVVHRPAHRRGQLHADLPRLPAQRQDVLRRGGLTPARGRGRGPTPAMGTKPSLTASRAPTRPALSIQAGLYPRSPRVGLCAGLVYPKRAPRRMVRRGSGIDNRSITSNAHAESCPRSGKEEHMDRTELASPTGRRRSLGRGVVSASSRSCC